MARSTETKRTGIYTRTTESITLRRDDNGHVIDEDLPDRAAFWDGPRAMTVKPSILDKLDAAEKWAAEEIGERSIDKPQTERQIEAENVRHEVAWARHYIAQNDADAAAYHAFRLAQIAERLGVRDFEPFAKRAIDNEQKRKTGHERKYNTTKKRQLVQEAAKNIRAENPRIKQTTLVKRIVKAAAAGGWTVSERSIWNYLKPKAK